ncbi:uncharacterized protein LOC134837855 [Culicoides brevitarsis]|uniref:uncharacterized protein LOC134837855 n=1 Tax=Culicoides brevitarsis TaxID=469753 RepID=UPI00307B6E92
MEGIVDYEYCYECDESRKIPAVDDEVSYVCSSIVEYDRNINLKCYRCKSLQENPSSDPPSPNFKIIFNNGLDTVLSLQNCSSSINCDLSQNDDDSYNFCITAFCNSKSKIAINYANNFVLVFCLYCSIEFIRK